MAKKVYLSYNEDNGWEVWDTVENALKGMRDSDHDEGHHDELCDEWAERLDLKEKKVYSVEAKEEADCLCKHCEGNGYIIKKGKNR